MSEMNEKIIEKIRKCLELANNNPSEEEAKSAALMAQKLLAKYNISMADVEDVTKDCEEIVENVIWFDTLANWGVARGWKYELADIVAKNFRCKHFFYGKKGVVFYGHKTDADIAAQVYTFLFKNGDKLANRLAHKANRETRKRGYGNNTAGVYNSFVKGYMAGLREALDKQCTALMIVVPQDVSDAYAAKSKGFAHMKAGMKNTGYNSDAYNEGHRAGKDAMASREIAG